MLVVASEPRGAVAGLVPKVRDVLGRIARGGDERTPEQAERHAVVERLRAALDAHDLDRLVACFHAEYRGELPLHPTAGAIDRQQVRRNWERILGDVPDVRGDLLDTAHSADAIWTEWRIWGTRRDGEALDLRSVWIFGIRDNQIAWSRLYREPIHADEETTVDETVERLTRPA